MTTDAADVSETPNGHGGRRGRRRDAMDTRGRAQIFWDFVFAAIRGIALIAKNFYATFGILLLAGALVAIAGTYAFARFASHVSSGRTQAFDDAVLRWVADHRSPTLEPVMLEVTFLGTGTVVITIVAVSALFLWLTKHRYSAVLLLIATFGSIVLNNLLKMGFGRPRPQLFDWGTHVVSWSFPSGHAMSAAVVYGTVAYLAARLQTRHLHRVITLLVAVLLIVLTRHLHRVITLLVAVLLIVLIGVTRLYLGVHYPSDVIAGVIIGLAWAAFCMTTLEAIQLYARRRAPRILKDEQPPARDSGT